MIKTMDLIQWAKQNAVGCSASYPAGWIKGEDLEKLARAVIKREPFDYSPVYRGRHDYDDGSVLV